MDREVVLPLRALEFSIRMQVQERDQGEHQRWVIPTQMNPHSDQDPI